MKSLEEQLAAKTIGVVEKQDANLFRAAADGLINDLCYCVINPEIQDEPAAFYIGYFEAQLEELYKQWSEDFEIQEDYDRYLHIIDMAKELEAARAAAKDWMLEIARVPRYEATTMKKQRNDHDNLREVEI